MTKNRINDVCDHLVAALEALGDESKTPEQMSAAIERAKATAVVAQAYTGVVRAELDGARVAADLGLVPSFIRLDKMARLQDVPLLPAGKGGER